MGYFTLACAAIVLVAGSARAQNVPAFTADSNGVLTAEATDFRLTALGGGGGTSMSFGSLSTAVSSTAALLSSTIDSNSAGDSSTSTLISQLSNQISTQIATHQGDSTGMSNLVSSISTAVTNAATGATQLSAQVSSGQSTLSAAISSQMSAAQSMIAALAPAPPPPGNPTSCRDLIERFNASAPTGMYTVQPPGQSPFQVYCENDFYGGGWTMVTKINAGPFNTNTNPRLTTQTMYDMIANPVNDVMTNLMTNDDFPYPPAPMGPYYVASLNRAKTNALGTYTFNKGQSPILRVDLKQNVDARNTVGTYMQQLAAPPSNFDFWGAIRDARKWSNFTSGYQVVGFGSNFRLTHDPASFSARANEFVHDSCGDPSFGYWGARDVTVAGQQVSVSRHGGLLGDGYCNGGNLWLMTYDSGDGRFMNDHLRQSVVYIR